MRYGGRRIADVPTHEVCHLGIARTFQIVKPFASLTARENVAVGAMYGREGSKRSTRAAFERADELLEIVGLARVAYQRCQRPDDPRPQAARGRQGTRAGSRGLLLDEVMAGLNATEVDEALELLRARQRARRHADRRRAPDEGDRLDLDLDRGAGRGRKIAEGAPAECSPRRK